MDDVTVVVVGIDRGRLPDGAAEVVRSARLVIGDRQHVETHAPESARTLDLDPREAAWGALSSLAGSESGVVLVPGDPGLFGVVREIREHGIRCTVLPGLSGVQLLMGRVGRSWEDVAIVDAGDGNLARAINVCRARSATAVLTARGAGPAQLGSGLEGWRRTMIVAEGLGDDDESLTTVDPAEAAKKTWRQPSVVLCLADANAAPARSWLAGGDPHPPESGWGLAEDAFSHRDGMVTGAEVRAVALAKLAPRPGTLVWDVGAGSGSVAVECARLGAATIAVESDGAQVVRMVTNAAGHGVDVRIEEGSAPKALRELPKPDSVFVGGGGADVLTSCAHAGAARIVVALSALDRVSATRDALRNAGYEVEGVQLTASRLVESPGGAACLEPASPVVLLSGVRAGSGTS